MEIPKIINLRLPMKTNFSPFQLNGPGSGSLPRSLFGTVWLALLLVIVAPLRAEIPEPANVFYGLVALGTNPVSAVNTAVTVEARHTPTGPAVASYRMGGQPALNNYYSLQVNLESSGVSLASNSVQTGEAIYLTVTLSGVMQEQKKVNIGTRGQITRLDFGMIDSDHNGLTDPWEQQYFGRLGVDPNADPDHDGRSNLQEKLDGTNPLLGDSSHPADMNPTNNAISIGEMVAYSLAWKNGQPWTVAPTNIPVSYVVRAGALWKGGETYRFDTNSTTAPTWWVSGTNMPSTNASISAVASTSQARTLAASSVNSSLPASYLPGVPFIITNIVTPASDVAVYAVEDQPPAGWTVTSVSSGGTFDAANGKIKWGLFFDNTTRQLTYQVTPPPTAQGPASFAGQASFDGLTTLDIGGQRISTFVAPRQLEALALTPAGTPHFIVRGVLGQSLDLQYSTNLQTWLPLVTIQIPVAGSYEHVDNTNVSRTRFYRVRPTP